MMDKITTWDKLILRLQEINEKGILDAEYTDRSENMRCLFMYLAMMVPATKSAIVQAFLTIKPKVQNNEVGCSTNPTDYLLCHLNLYI